MNLRPTNAATQPASFPKRAVVVSVACESDELALLALKEKERQRRIRLKYLLKKEAEPTPVPSGSAVVPIPVTQIHVAKHLFQNRETDFSEESVSRIVKAVEAGAFRWEVFDPVVLWSAPDGKLYILSGHSRTEAFRRLARMGYGEFKVIPAKIFRGSQAEAVKIALNSNTLSTKETLTERAAYYRKQREAGIKAKEVEDEARDREGKNATTVIALSYLNPNGQALQAVSTTEGSEVTGSQNALTLATWLGEARRRFPELTNSHERELYDWLVGGAYGTRAGQISNKPEFLNRVQSLILKNTVFGAFNAGAPLNPLNRAVKSSVEAEYERELADARRNLKDAEEILVLKEKEFKERSNDPVAIVRALGPFEAAVRMRKIELMRLVMKKDDVRDAVRSQTTLFGLGSLAYGIPFVPYSELEETGEGLGQVGDEVQRDIYATITARLVNILEAAEDLPWRKTWDGKSGYSNPPSMFHVNGSTKRRYSGINIFLLSLENYVRRDNNTTWLTYKQAESLGGQVRKGEKGTTVVFYTNDLYRNPVTGKTMMAAKWERLSPAEQSAWEPSWTLRGSTVFAAHQIDGLEHVFGERIAPKKRNGGEQIESCELIVANMPNRPPVLNDGGDRAYYRPATDEVHMPLMEHFDREQEYYVTLFHELVHSTGHKDRLNRWAERLTKGEKAKADYAFEELIAELGACYLAGEAGTLYFHLQNSGAYLQGWLRSLVAAMKEDKKFIFKAAAAAQKAADYILNRVQVPPVAVSGDTGQPDADADRLALLALKEKERQRRLRLLKLKKQ